MKPRSFLAAAIPFPPIPRRGTLWCTVTALCITPLFPLSNFVGHPHWEAIRWIPFRDASWSINSLIDIIGNTVWFMIAGYLCDYLQQSEGTNSPIRSVAKVTALVATVSLLLELFQVFCHNRIPSMTDVACNVIGGALGSLLAEIYRTHLAAGGHQRRQIRKLTTNPS